MKLSSVLISLASCGAAFASLNATQIAQALPSCALQCSVELLPAANCSLLNSAPCLCTNVTLLAQVSKCVQQNCTFSDQVQGAAVQNQICEGYPQESRSQYLLSICIILLVITILFLVLRILCRYKISRQFWPDDWAAIGSTVVVLAAAGVVMTATAKGFGKHYWNIDPDSGVMIFKLFYSLQVFYTLIQDLAKISLLLFYIRIFPTKTFRLLCQLMILFVVAHGTAFFMAIIFQCSPIRFVWDKSIQGQCLDLTAVGYAGAAMSIFEDVVILVLPMRKLSKLNITTGKKWGLMVMFAVGSFACVTSAIRLKYISSFAANDYDPSWNNVDILVWSIVEVDTALICACLPILKPLLMTFLPNFYSKYFSHGGTENESHGAGGTAGNASKPSFRFKVWKPSFSGSGWSTSGSGSGSGSSAGTTLGTRSGRDGFIGLKDETENGSAVELQGRDIRKEVRIDVAFGPGAESKV